MEFYIKKESLSYLLISVMEKSRKILCSPINVIIKISLQCFYLTGYIIWVMKRMRSWELNQLIKFHNLDPRQKKNKYNLQANNLAFNKGKLCFRHFSFNPRDWQYHSNVLKYLTRFRTWSTNIMIVCPKYNLKSYITNDHFTKDLQNYLSHHIVLYFCTRQCRR